MSGKLFILSAAGLPRLHHAAKSLTLVAGVLILGFPALSEVTFNDRVKDVMERWNEIEVMTKGLETDRRLHIITTMKNDSKYSNCQFAQKWDKKLNSIFDHEVATYDMAYELKQDVEVLIVETWDTGHKDSLLVLLSKIDEITETLYKTSKQYEDIGKDLFEGYVKRNCKS